jgi:hypothetical protein
MKRFRHSLSASLLLAIPAVFPAAAIAQTPSAKPAPLAASAPTPVPALLPFSGTAAGSDGKPLDKAEVSVTFLLFTQQTGGEPVWTETQTVATDATGHYDVQLGASSATGLPLTTFAAGDGRWLEVQVAGQKPEARVLLMSVPYAMKAADAATLGGLPASAYALAGAATATGDAKVTPDASAAAVTTPGGTAGYLPVYSAAAIVDDSILFESGTKLGINTNVPAATLDLNGTLAARGAVTLESTGAAAATAGKDSQQLQFSASAYNSTSKAAVTPLFALQAEPAANNTAAPAGTLNLLYGTGTVPGETGLSITSKGLINFAAGQTFPSTGTITGVTTTAPLTGSGTTGSIALGLNLTALETTLNTKYPQLAVASKFNAPVTFGTSVAFDTPVTFASTQTFPGTGKGTITGVTTTTPLTGSGTTGSIALGLNLTALETTLNTKYPQLAVASKFTAPITFGSSVAFGVPVTFAATQTFPGTGKGTITGVSTTSPLTGSGTTGSVALGLNLPVLETTLNTKYAQLAVANKFTAPVTFGVPVTFAATQTFPGLPGGGTITGITTTSPLTGTGTKGSVAIGLNLTALATTLNASYAQLNAVNKFTQPITFVATQTFPNTITSVTAGTGLIGSTTAGAVKLSLDPKAIPTLTSSPVFTSSADGVQGVTAGTTLNTAGVQGEAGAPSGAGTGIAGVWGDAYSHVGVLGTSYQYSGVQGISTNSYGVQGSSTSNTAVLGTSSSGTGVSGLSTTNSGVAGYTPGTTVNTAGVNGKAGALSGITQIVAGVWGDSYQQVGVEGTSSQSVGVYGQSTGYNGVVGISNVAIGVAGNSNSGTGMAGSSNTGAGMIGYTSGTILNTSGVIGIAGPRTSAFNGIAGLWGDAANHVGVLGTSNIYPGIQGQSLNNAGVEADSTSGNGLHAVSNSTSGIFGETSSTSGGDAAVYALSHAGAIGVFGFSPKFGIEGESGGNSGVGAMSSVFVNGPAAVWGDTSSAGYAVVGTTDNGVAGQFINNSPSQEAMYVGNFYNGNSTVATLTGQTGGCTFFGNGDVLCDGKISSAVKLKDSQTSVKTYSVQSTENWYEDAGSAKLVNGVVHVELESTFSQTVNTEVAYQVFLTPGGDSEGLYVTNKTANGFDVHEQHGGHSNIDFDYRIMAKRTGHETERLEEVTPQIQKQAERRTQMVQAIKAAPAMAEIKR